MISATPPPTPEPDTTDWTVVLDRPCTECGFDPAAAGPQTIPGRITATRQGVLTALQRRDAADRPAPQTWSVVEYAQHIADVTEVMTRRLRLILDSGGTPVTFASWDGDTAAIENEYWKASAEVTAVLVRQRLDAAATTWAEPVGDRWTWQGVRGDGFTFTAASLGRYFAHELQHHLQDATH